MTGHDIYLLSPELSLVGVALLVLFADFVLKDRRILPLIVLLGLAAIVLVMLMGGRLRRRVRDELPPVGSPDPMWPLQVPPTARENTGDPDDDEFEDLGDNGA